MSLRIILEATNMLRIRGTVGPWPVDLTLELEPEDWAGLGRALAGSVPDDTPATASEPAPAPADGRAHDRQWQLACELLRGAGELDGPSLLAQLAGLVGGVQAGKRLLVRLRHSPEVAVASRGDTAVYRWVGENQ